MVRGTQHRDHGSRFGLSHGAPRAGIDVSITGIRITRLLRREVVRWEQIEAIAVSDTPHPQIVVYRTSSSPIMTGLYRDFPGARFEVWLRPKPFDRLVTRLQQMHGQTRGDFGVADNHSSSSQG